MQVFVDESGNLGIGDRYFVLAALICMDEGARKRVRRMVKKAKIKLARNGEILDELHAVRFGFVERQFIVNKILEMKSVFFTVLLVDKHNLTFPLNRETRNIGYNYLSGLLVRIIVERTQGPLAIMFDRRSTRVRSQNSLLDYIRIKMNLECNVARKIDVVQADSCEVYGIQVADFVANLCYRRLKGKNKDLFERLFRSGMMIVNKFPMRGFGEGDEVLYNSIGT